MPATALPMTPIAGMARSYILSHIIGRHVIVSQTTDSIQLPAPARA